MSAVTWRSFNVCKKLLEYLFLIHHFAVQPCCCQTSQRAKCYSLNSMLFYCYCAVNTSALRVAGVYLSGWIMCCGVFKTSVHLQSCGFGCLVINKVWIVYLMMSHGDVLSEHSLQSGLVWTQSGVSVTAALHKALQNSPDQVKLQNMQSHQIPWRSM